MSRHQTPGPVHFSVYLVEEPPDRVLARYNRRIVELEKDKKANATELADAHFKRSIVLQIFYVDERIGTALSDIETAVVLAEPLPLRNYSHYEVRLAFLMHYQIVCHPAMRPGPLAMQIVRLKDALSVYLEKNAAKITNGLLNPEMKFANEYADLRRRMQATIAIYEKAENDVAQMVRYYDENCNAARPKVIADEKARQDLSSSGQATHDITIVEGSTAYIKTHCDNGLLRELTANDLKGAESDYKKVIDHGKDKRSKEFALCCVRYARIIYYKTLHTTDSPIQKKSELKAAMNVLQSFPRADEKEEGSKRQVLLQRLQNSIQIFDEMIANAAAVKLHMYECQTAYLAFGQKLSDAAKRKNAAQAQQQSVAAGVPPPAAATVQGAERGQKRKLKEKEGTARAAAGGGGGGSGDEKAASAAAAPKRPKLKLRFTEPTSVAAATSPASSAIAAAGGGGGAAPMVISGNSSSVLGAKQKGKPVTAAGAAAAAAPAAEPTGSHDHPIPVSMSCD